LGTKKTPPNIEVFPESLEAMLEYCCIELILFILLLTIEYNFHKSRVHTSHFEVNLPTHLFNDNFYLLSLDKDECNVNNGGCDIVNGLCINTPGSYHCRCKQGYELKENSELVCEGK